jgi:hypothetical protein
MCDGTYLRVRNNKHLYSTGVIQGGTICSTGTVKGATLCSTGHLHVTGGQLIGGLGAVTTAGTTDWNHSTNARAGMGYTLLLGQHTNGHSFNNSYYHVMNFEYAGWSGAGNMTQVGIPYSGNTIAYRSRYSGNWSGWTKVWDCSNDGAGSGLDADLLDGNHASAFATGNYAAMNCVSGTYNLRFQYSNEFNLYNGSTPAQQHIQYRGGGTNISQSLSVAHQGTVSTPYTLQGAIVCATSSFCGVEYCSTSWYRNHSTNTGLYNTTNQTYFTSSANNSWRMASSQSTMCLQMASSAGTVWGALYGNSSLEIGILDAGGSWAYLHKNDTCSEWRIANSDKMKLTSSSLCVTGAFTASGDITAYSSDCRLKCNILTITCAVDRVKALRGVEFEWDKKYICDKNLNFTPSEKGKTVGFIAQELENTLPTAVREAPFEETLCRTASWSEKYKTVKAEKILPLLVEATKEQQCVIERQQRQINKLTCQMELLLRKCA